MQIRYEDSQRQIHALARRVLRRAHAAGARSVQREDVVSELSIAWCVTRDRFDASLGVPFGAYLRKGMLDHINRWVQTQIDEAQGVSLDMQIGSGDNERSIAEIIPDASVVLPDEHAERESRRRLVMKNLSGNAETFVRLLENSSEMTAILAAHRERSEFAKSRGVVPSPVPRDVTFGMVFDLMNLSRRDRHEVLEDLRFWAER